VFDRVFSINSVQFWDDLERGMCECKRVLLDGGLAGIAIEPRNKGATAETSREWAVRLESVMHDIGFANVRVVKSSGAIPTVCALARK
jgi:hypothetical protein